MKPVLNASLLGQHYCHLVLTFVLTKILIFFFHENNALHILHCARHLFAGIYLINLRFHNRNRNRIEAHELCCVEYFRFNSDVSKSIINQKMTSKSHNMADFKIK